MFMTLTTVACNMSIIKSSCLPHKLLNIGHKFICQTYKLFADSVGLVAASSRAYVPHMFRCLDAAGSPSGGALLVCVCVCGTHKSKATNKYLWQSEA